MLSLTTTPMMCAQWLRSETSHGALYRASERAFAAMLRGYDATLSFVLRHAAVTLLVTLCTIGLTGWLVTIVPKGFFPQQDTGRITGSIQAQQDISFPRFGRRWSS